MNVQKLMNGKKLASTKPHDSFNGSKYLMALLSCRLYVEGLLLVAWECNSLS